jgi:hypothetical protein
LPITLLPYNSHFGLALDSWLGYGLIFTLGAFLLEFCLYKLLIFKLLVQKGLVYIPSERESEFSQNEILFKKVFKTFSIIFLCLMAGLITVSILDDNNAIDTAQTLYICLTISHIINLCACASWYYVKSKNNKTKE